MLKITVGYRTLFMQEKAAPDDVSEAQQIQAKRKLADVTESFYPISTGFPPPPVVNFVTTVPEQ